VSEQHLKTIHRYIDRMPSLSTTVTKVLEVCNKPNVSPNDLNKVISLDPVLSGNVLKLINSAYYSLPNHINSLTRAIIVLGINTVKNLALTTSVLSTVKEKNQSGLSMDKFWSHSLCVAVTAKAMAVELKVPMHQREEFFLSGLLHDLGKIPMSKCFPEEYARCLALCSSNNIPLHEAENIVFGFDHQHCGAMIAEKWNLSDNIISVLKYHHQVINAAEDHKTLTLCVAIANLYANIFNMSTNDNDSINETDVSDLFEHSQLSWRNISPLHEKIQDAIEKASVFLKVN
jgi:putative nucleotidyltransferase with HDIG domain